MINEITHIAKLRAQLSPRGSVKNDPAFRSRLSSLLSNETFQPVSMPPASILIIRKMHDPLPGKLSILTQQFKPDKSWQDAMNNQLNKIYHSAEKPINGILYGNAPAVVFADKAELLACFVKDVVSARADQCWWWKTLLKQQSFSANVSATVLNVFRQDIEYLPATMVKLHSWKLSQPVIRCLQKGDALKLCIALTSVYQLTDLHDVLKSHPGLNENAQQSTINVINISQRSKRHKITDSPVPDNKADITGDKDRPVNVVRNRLRSFFKVKSGVDSGPVGETAEQVMLAGLCIVLYQQPWQASHYTFQKSLIDIIENRNSSPGTIDNETSSNIINVTDLHQQEPIVVTPDLSSHDRSTRINTAVTTDQADRNETALNEVAHSADVTADVDLVQAFNGQKLNIYEEPGIVTNLGGIFYLLNLITWLDIPACFENDNTQPDQDCSLQNRGNQDVLCNTGMMQLSPWAWLEIIAHSILAKAMSHFEDDAIWTLLHDLQGDVFPLQLDSELPADYWLPDNWFKQVCRNGETYYWTVMQGRLYVWSGDGFLLVNMVSRADAASEQADEVLRRYLGRHDTALLVHSESNNPPIDRDLLTGRYFSELNPSIRQWIICVMPFIHHQLTLVTGLNSEEFVAQILQCRGQIHVSSTHIDFSTSLDNISIAARRAGMDRDPGWLAHAGRVVSFHFD